MRIFTLRDMVYSYILYMQEREPRHSSPFRRAEGPSPAERTRAILTQLEEAVGAIQDSVSFHRYLDLQSRFHHYSFGNVLLILSQRPEATRVAGYRTWQGLGRQVRKGEQAIKIVVPMPKKAADAATGEAQTLMRFGVGNVFDVAQTEGEPLPDLTVPVLAGDAGGQLYAGLEQVAAADGVTVERNDSYAPGYPDRMGHYEPTTRKVVVRGGVSQLQQTKTLAHELAHHFTGIYERYDEHRAEHETIAEASAYVVLKHFGLESGERSIPYVAAWSQDRATLKGVLGTIQGVSNTIISRIEAQHGTPVGPPAAD